MIQTAYLVDYADVIPTLAKWFKEEWPDYYANRTIAAIAQEFQADLNRDKLPIRLVALLNNEPVGTIVLRELVISTHPEHHPGLGGLYVAKPHRRHGIGTELIQAGMALARELGYHSIYTTTNVAGGIFEHLRWEYMGPLIHHGEEIALYRYVINTIAS